MGSILVCSPANKPLGVFSGPHRGQQNVDLQQISRHFSSKDGFIQDHQRIGIWGLQTVNLVQVLPSPPPMAREEHFYRGGKKVERAIVNIVRGFSLSESLPGKKNLPSSYWVLLSSHDMGAPPSGLSILFAWDFCLLLLFFLFYKIFTLLECQIRRVFFCSLEILYLILHILSVEEQK